MESLEMMVVCPEGERSMYLRILRVEGSAAARIGNRVPRE